MLEVGLPTANYKLYVNPTLILYPRLTFSIWDVLLFAMPYLHNPSRVEGCPIYWGDAYLK